jgi:protein phosphatase PTC2/3
LESQEVVDFIRHLVAEGKSLTEISELMCDHCIAPDTSAGTGCDNMTIMIIALLHGRTLEEWQEWVKDRVEKEIGYKTRRSLPSLYSEIRKTAFWKKMKEFEEQGVISKWSKGRDGNSIGSGSGSSDDPDSFGSNTIVLGSSGGISFQPGGSILSDSGRLMFDHDDDDDGMTILGLGGLHNHSSLRARLEAFEMEDDLSSDEEGKMSPTAADDDPSVLHSPPSDSDTGSTLLPNGDAAKLIPPVEQLSSLPSGDAADPVTRIEGMLDTSENPLKT